MTDLVAELASIRDEVALRVPVEHHRPIAAVGAGAIMDLAHLPAYRGRRLAGARDHRSRC